MNFRPLSLFTINSKGPTDEFHALIKRFRVVIHIDMRDSQIFEIKLPKE
jgi:hypothetical protein